MSKHFAVYRQHRYQSVGGAVGFGPFALVQKNDDGILPVSLHLPIIKSFANRTWSAILIGSFAHFSSSGEISSRPATRPIRSLSVALL